MKTFSTFSCTPYLSLKLETGSKLSFFTFKRYIRAEVVTYRLDVVFGSLHTQQLHGFDELRNDQKTIQNRSAKIKKMTTSLYLPSSHSSFRFLRVTQKNRANKNRVFGRSDRSQDNLNKGFSRTTR
jgi:hypothetical protein